MEERLVFYKDIHNEAEEALFERIRTGSENLYELLMNALEKGESVGIRIDVLNYLADHAVTFGTDMSFLFLISGFACNPVISVEFLDFADEYFNRSTAEKKFSFDDFGVLFSACIDKGIPLSEMKRLFYSDKDVVDIYADVDKFDASDDEYPDETSSMLVSDPEDVPYDMNVSYAADVRQSSKSKGQGMENASSDVDMFNNLVTVMTYQDKDSMEELNKAEENFSDVISKFSASVSDLSSICSLFLNSMKKDKEEIKKLNAMITLIQKLLTSKQNEINNLRGEVSRLNDRIRSSEKAELRRDALNQKISEAYHLALNSNALGSDSLYSTND